MNNIIYLEDRFPVGSHVLHAALGKCVVLKVKGFLRLIEYALPAGPELKWSTFWIPMAELKPIANRRFAFIQKSSIVKACRVS